MPYTVCRVLIILELYQIGVHPHPWTNALSGYYGKYMFVIHLLTKTGKEYGLTDELYKSYCEAYSGVDVFEELKKMKIWCISNEPKRKTARGMPRFINNWLSDAKPKPRSTAPDKTRDTNIFDDLADTSWAD